MPMVFITAAMNAICSTTVPVGTRLHWSTDSRPVWVGWEVLWTGGAVWLTNLNWTKTCWNSLSLRITSAL